MLTRAERDRLDRALLERQLELDRAGVTIFTDLPEGATIPAIRRARAQNPNRNRRRRWRD